DADGIGRWVAGLPDEEVRTAIARVVAGEGLAVQTELQSRYHRSASASASVAESPVGARSVGELLALADEAARDREQRQREERERKRREHLAALVPRFPILWDSVEKAAQRGTASGYDAACQLLVELRDAYGAAARSAEFDAAFDRFRAEHGARPALRRRL